MNIYEEALKFHEEKKGNMKSNLPVKLRLLRI